VKISVVGARGFIGSAIAQTAVERGHNVARVMHDSLPMGQLGTVIYASGLAFGADKNPLDAYLQHVAVPLALLREGRCDRLIYISSTRVYDRALDTREQTPLVVDPADRASTYSASKVAGEAAILGAGERNIVCRLSNVAGPSVRSSLFLSDVVRQAVVAGRISLRTALDSSKDYVRVDDAARIILEIAESGRERVYNVASGSNTTHRELVGAIREVLPVEVSVPEDAPTSVVPVIDINRIRAEFGFLPGSVLEMIPKIVDAFERAK
jgi:nucleoside-diphosphate-sugar epimerase